MGASRLAIGLCGLALARGMQIGAGWNPHYHQSSDRYASYSDKDFRLGLNAAQTTLAAIAQLTGATLRR